MGKTASTQFDPGFFKAVVDNAGEAIFLFNSQGDIVYANNMALKTSGYSAHEILGMHVSALNRFTDKLNQEVFTYLMSHLHQNKAWTGHFESLRKDGSSFPSTTTFSLVQDEKTQYLICVQRPSEDRSKLQIQLQRTQMSAMKHARMAALGEMAAGIAHEINNPLAIIAGNLHLIQTNANKPDFSTELLNKYAEKVEKSIMRIQNVIRSMKTLVHRDLKTDKKKQSLQPIVEDTLGLCAEKFRNKGVRLEFTPFPYDVLVKCDSGQVSQILINLLNNACDAVEHLTDKWIKVECLALDKTLTISVTDSGSSLSPTLAKKIFKPFHSSKPVGMGLGLSLSRNFAEEHRGSLDVDLDSPNTRFQLKLPRAKSDSEQPS